MELELKFRQSLLGVCEQKSEKDDKFINLWE